MKKKNYHSKTNNKYTFPSLPECPLGWWTCHDKLCIPGSAVCDGVQDCTSGDDEADCSCCKVTIHYQHYVFHVTCIAFAFSVSWCL